MSRRSQFNQDTARGFWGRDNHTSSDSYNVKFDHLMHCHVLDTDTVVSLMGPPRNKLTTTTPPERQPSWQIGKSIQVLQIIFYCRWLRKRFPCQPQPSRCCVSFLNSATLHSAICGDAWDYGMRPESSDDPRLPEGASGTTLLHENDSEKEMHDTATPTRNFFAFYWISAQIRLVIFIVLDLNSNSHC